MPVQYLSDSEQSQVPMCLDVEYTRYGLLMSVKHHPTPHELQWSRIVLIACRKMLYNLEEIPCLEFSSCI